MTAQATTAGDAPAADGQQAGQSPTPAAQAPEPQSQTSPQASPDGQVDPRDAEIQNLEKRNRDKDAYIEELRSKIPDKDRTITALQREVQQSATPPQPEPRVAMQQQPAPNVGDQQRAAAELGMSDAEFVDALRREDNTALTKLYEVMDRRVSETIDGRLPELVAQHMLALDTQRKIAHLTQDIGDDGVSKFYSTLGYFEQQGFRPTPEQVVATMKHGTVERQMQLMAFAEEVLAQRVAAQQTQEAGQPPAQGQQPPQQQQQLGQGVRAYPFAPGGSSPAAPASNQQQQQNTPELPGSWAINRDGS